jgi:Cu-Zn family superoxide dismutase
MRISLIGLSLGLMICSSATAQMPDMGKMTMTSPMTTTIKSTDGSAIGTLTLTGAASGVLLQIDITTGLTPGWHGMHFHQTGDCSDAKFMNTGSHMNHAEAKKPHGLLNPAGPDFGDLVNIYAAADGSAHAQAFTELVRLDPGSGLAGQVLRDGDGSALVIHANPDDHMTQPIGGSGPRVACAVIK